MRKALACALLVVACGSDNKQTPDAAKPTPPDAAAPDAFVPDAAPDAPNFDFSCAGQPQGTVSATITVSGTAQAQSGMSAAPAANVTLQLVKRGTAGDDTVLATAGPTGSDGTFTFAAQTTNGNALDVYVHGALDQSRDSYVFPAKTLVTDESGVPVLMTTTALLNQLGQLVGQTEMAGQGAMVVEVFDCENALVAGSTLSVKQGSADAGTIIDVGQFLSQLSGTFFVFNVPPGTTTVSASLGSTQLSSHDVETFADGTTETEVVP